MIRLLFVRGANYFGKPRGGKYPPGGALGGVPDGEQLAGTLVEYGCVTYPFVMNEEASSVAVTHLPGQHCFQAALDEQTARMHYVLGNDFIVLAHTEVSTTLSHRSITQPLIRSVLLFARKHQLQVMPLCPLVAVYIRRHPEYRPLLRPGFEV